MKRSKKIKKDLKKEGIDDYVIVDSDRVRQQANTGIRAAVNKLKPSERQKAPKKREGTPQYKASV